MVPLILIPMTSKIIYDIDDETSGGTFINSGTLYLGTTNSEIYVGYDGTVNFYQCPTSGLIYFTSKKKLMPMTLPPIL